MSREREVQAEFYFLTWYSGYMGDTERWTPQTAAAQYPTGEEWTNSSRKNVEAEPKRKQYQVVEVTSVRSKVRCYKNYIA